MHVHTFLRAQYKPCCYHRFPQIWSWLHFEYFKIHRIVTVNNYCIVWKVAAEYCIEGTNKSSMYECSCWYEVYKVNLYYLLLRIFSSSSPYLMDRINRWKVYCLEIWASPTESVQSVLYHHSKSNIAITNATNYDKNFCWYFNIFLYFLPQHYNN